MSTVLPLAKRFQGCLEAPGIGCLYDTSLPRSRAYRPPPLATLRDVIDAYRPKFRRELETEWAAALLYRPVSLLLTPLVAATGVSPTFVTGVALLVALSLPAVAWMGSHPALQVGLLAIVFCILDCMDGDLARLTRKTSIAGAYADFITDLVYRVCVYVALGLLIGSAPHAEGLVIALGCVVLALLSRACRLYHEANAPPAAPQTPTSARPKTVPDLLFTAASGVDHLLPVLVLALGSAGHADWVLGWLVVYSLGDFVVTQLTSIPRKT